MKCKEKQFRQGYCIDRRSRYYVCTEGVGFSVYKYNDKWGKHMGEKFVPDDFMVPVKYETEEFRLRMLTVDDVEKDYEAVMSSREHLRSIIDPEDDDTWPEENMTILENLEDLKRHQADFLDRSAFVYTVVSLDESKCLGTVYIYPCQIRDYGAEIYLWARQSELERGLEKYLYRTVQAWIDGEWPFQRVIYPGRSISWPEWRSKNGA